MNPHGSYWKIMIIINLDFLEFREVFPGRFTRIQGQGCDIQGQGGTAGGPLARMGFQGKGGIPVRKNVHVFGIYIKFLGAMLDGLVVSEPV